MSNIKENMVIYVFLFLLDLLHYLLLHSLFYILAFQAFAGRAAFLPRAMALTVFFQTVTFLAFTLRHTSVAFCQEKSVPVSTGYAFAV